jgi:hypothetical protein
MLVTAKLTAPAAKASFVILLDVKVCPLR